MDDTADGTLLLPPLKAVTSTDHGGIVAITTSLGIVFGAVSVLIRSYVRIECRASFGRDDHAALAALLVAVVQAVVVFLAIGRGFGTVATELTATDAAAAQRDMFVSELLFVAGLWLTKSSVALLLTRLSREPSHTVMARGLVAAAAAYAVVSLPVVGVRVGCDAARPWDTAATPGCASSVYARWAAVTALDVATEAALFAGGVWLVHDLKLAWRKKSVVVVAYGLRLPVVAAAAVRLYYVRVALAADDPSFAAVPAAVCTQVQLAYAVVAATMPCLKPFMNALNTQYGGGNTFVLSHTSPSSSALQRSRDLETGAATAATSTTATTATTTTTSKARGKTRALVMSGAVAAAAAAAAGTTVVSSSCSSCSSTAAAAAAADNHHHRTGLSLSTLSTHARSGRHSTESETRILDGTAAPVTTRVHHPPSSSSSSATASAVAVAPNGRSTKITSISAAANAYALRAGARSPPNVVSVTTDITVREEKDSAIGIAMSPV